jgi:hypothetical protein
MATISLTTELDVLNKYTALLKESLGSESVYIRAKETIEDLAKEGDLPDSEKAKMIAEVVGGLSGSLANASMSAALQWASSEKELAFKKIQLEKELDILDSDKELKDVQIEKVKTEDVATQAQMIRTYGTPTVDANNLVTSLSDSGKVHEDIQLVRANVIKVGKENNVLDSKLKESHVAIHKVVADTYRNYGTYTYSITDQGVTEVTGTSNNVTLSDLQQVIAEEQSKGYAYNAWANAATSSASFLATALSSDLGLNFSPENGETTPEKLAMDKYLETMGYLAAVNAPAIP